MKQLNAVDPVKLKKLTKIGVTILVGLNLFLFQGVSGNFINPKQIKSDTVVTPTTVAYAQVNNHGLYNSAKKVQQQTLTLREQKEISPANTQTTDRSRTPITNRGDVSLKDRYVQDDSTGIKSILWRVAQENNLPYNFLYGVAMVETGGTLDSSASGTHANGLMQLVPNTARAMGVKNVFDPYDNATGAAKYLNYLISKYQSETIKDNNGKVLDTKTVAIIAYNWGETNLDNHIDYYGFIYINRLPQETQNYLIKLHNYY